MTFYWWSHWFWITLILSANLFASYVHTYPHQDTAVTQPVRTTKLYQTTVSQNWATATQSNIMDLTHRPQVGREEEPDLERDAETRPEADPETDPEPDREDEMQEEKQKDPEPEPDAEEDQVEQEQREQDTEQPEPKAETETIEQLAQFEFKRSADFTADQLNNFTNFSSSTSTNGSISSSTTKPVPIAGTTTNSVESGRPIEGSSAGSAVEGTPTTDATTLVAKKPDAPAKGQSTSTMVPGAATPSTPKIHTEWLSDELLAGTGAGTEEGAGASPAEGEKAPFTLENANKEEELRRAETEHRSRKSKVLSAEYKHINRYINFSSDTKSLLTRSASAAPSISGNGFYDGSGGPDEGNISSEALAIQRTYFLDAGAISAICFTVFGVCCTVGTIGIVLYRRRYLNKPQALSEPDSSVYIDDSTMRVSDNSDEMYSLDNDSFLNSLEAMTIQNYWTDTVKHTKL
ncbi:hypothetical protein KR018_010019 [Drosophila ironensis]|nr:hypothetical protein KR018_010019 [Drosophila ironensis]